MGDDFSAMKLAIPLLISAYFQLALGTVSWQDLITEWTASNTGPGAPPASVGQPVGYFLRSMPVNSTKTLNPSLPSTRADTALAGFTHYRLLPGVFPAGMKFHFDGLATVMKLEFANGSLTVTSRAFESDAEKEYNKGCVFFGTGTGPTLGTHLCFTNPGVNLLPIGDQLWLTIDTANWGRVDPQTLDTLPSQVEVESLVLNAHPACDHTASVCYVQHPCSNKTGIQGKSPLSNQVCVSVLKPGTGDGNMQTELISRATLNSSKVIQHSHSPCLTQDFVVSKLDAFEARLPDLSNSGMLRYVHQSEDDQWLVMDRRTNQSTIMRSPNHSFVNNHFWNCLQQDDNILVETIPASSAYLDNYFQHNLEKSSTPWEKLLYPPLRCTITPGSDIECEVLLKDSTQLFDYPTFNPHFKMNTNYRFFYAIAPMSNNSRWFDSIIKVDRQSRTISAQWSSDGVFVTEADFIPLSNGVQPGDEDVGVLVSVLYNSTTDSSTIALFNSSDLTLLQMYPMGYPVPFHAHGISCAPNKPCWTNP